jgi:CheY-like chemotaxis protein
MRKILVVDDNKASRELMRAVLKAPCWQVFEASQGQEALDIVTREGPDLVLLDIEMPVLDGYAVLRVLRENPRFASLRVVAVTANAMHGTQESILSAGFDGYITKPIKASALRKLVAEFLGSPREAS